MHLHRTLAFRLALTFTLALAACTGGGPRPDEPPAKTVDLDALTTAEDLRERGMEAYQAGRYAEAGRLLAEAADIGWSTANDHYNAACSFALAGDPDAAFDQLHHAVNAGFHDAAPFEQDPDLSSLRDDARWAELLAEAEHSQALLHDPAAARLLTEDVERFWRAFDRAAALETLEEKERILRRDYIECGSPGLVDYYLTKIGSVEKLARFVADHEDFYRAVRPHTSTVTDAEETVRRIYRSLDALYADATFPDVTFVVGRLSSGGTVSERGLLIGTEMYSAAPDVPPAVIPAGAVDLVSAPDALPHTLAHELIHFQQNLDQEWDLLLVALIEGGADFLGELLLPGRPEPEYRIWGRAHERKVWERFSREMHGRDWSEWSGNNGSDSADWPADLAYFVGYEIARAYYERADDPRQAVRDLLELRDREAILAASGYGVRFADDEDRRSGP